MASSLTDSERGLIVELVDQGMITAAERDPQHDVANALRESGLVRALPRQPSGSVTYVLSGRAVRQWGGWSISDHP